MVFISLILTTTQAKADAYAGKSETTMVAWLIGSGSLIVPIPQATSNSVGFTYNQTSSTQRYVTKLDLCIIAHDGKTLYNSLGAYQYLGLINLSCYRNGSLINSFSGAQLTYGPAIVYSTDLYSYGYRTCNYLYDPIRESWKVEGTTYIYFPVAINSWTMFNISY